MPCHRRLLHSQCRSHVGGFIASAPPGVEDRYSSVRPQCKRSQRTVEDVNALFKVYTAPVSVPGVQSRAAWDAAKVRMFWKQILDAYGEHYHDAPTIRLTRCPRCGATTKREAVAIDRTTVRWVHHSGSSAADSPCRGDALDLVAAFEGLDRNRDFARLVERAAAIAGIGDHMSSAELDEIRQRREREQAAFERARAARRAAATAAVPARWAQLARRSIAGEAYLAGRGLDPAELTRADCVRFDSNGNPAVRLHAYDGAIVNIAQRMRHSSAPCKAPVLPDCTTDGTLVGKVSDIDTTGGGPDVAVLTEGIADTLAGVLAFTGCVVGSPGDPPAWPARRRRPRCHRAPRRTGTARRAGGPAAAAPCRPGWLITAVARRRNKCPVRVPPWVAVATAPVERVRVGRAVLVVARAIVLAVGREEARIVADRLRAQVVRPAAV